MRIRFDNLLDTALILCVIEIVVLFSTIAIEIASNHKFLFLTKIDAGLWLVFGGVSIVLSIICFAKGPTRLSAAIAFVLSIAVFVVCIAHLGAM